MSADLTPAPASAEPTEPAQPTGPGHGRSGLVVAAIMLALGIYLTVGVVTMEVPEGAKSPGPRLVPSILAGLCYALAVLLALQLLRHPEHPTDEEEMDEYGDRGARTFSDWRTLGICVGGFVAFIVLLVPVGWIVAAAVLFWATAWGMGSRRGLFDVGLALAFSSAIQVAFSFGLGLHLPPGILKGLF